MYLKERNVKYCLSVESCFVLQYKYGNNGRIERQKVTIVSRRLSHHPADLHDTYVPMVRKYINSYGISALSL